MSENQQTINGRVISVGKLPATKSLKVQVALVNLCGEALFKAVSSNKEDQEAAGAAALAALSARLDSEVIEKTMVTVFEYVTIDGERVKSIDASFANNVKDIWPTFFFALKVNFSDFFPAGFLSSLGKQVATLNPLNQQTSTGTSVVP